MTDHHRHRFGQLRSTYEILKKTAVHFTAHPFMFTFLSLLLLSFRTSVESGSFIDSDPSFKSLLTRLDLHPSHPHARFHSTRRHTRRPFLHLTLLGTLEGDFLSSEDDFRHRSPSSSFSNRPLNGTPVILSNFATKLGFSNFVADNGVPLPEIVRYGVKFKTIPFDYENNERERQEERIDDFQFVNKGFELGRHDAAVLFFVVSFLSAAYGWAVRDAVTQLLGLWYFGEIEDHYSFFKLFVRLKLLPFSVMSPRIRGYEKEISGFLFTWFLVDTLVSFAFSLAAWIAIVDSRRSGREIIKEGCYMMSTLLNQGIQVKCYEAILGGSLARLLLTRMGGEFFATVIQAALEVYFMVAWLMIFYFVVKCREANAEGRRYGRRELEALIDGLP